jgi:hypothetical protein
MDDALRDRWLGVRLTGHDIILRGVPRSPL